MRLPLVVLGGGQHAKVLIEMLQQQSRALIGYTTGTREANSKELLGVRCIGSDEDISAFTPDDVELVNGVGSAGLPGARTNLYLKFRNKGYRFATVVHPSAVLSPSVTLGEGAQVFAGAVVQTGAVLGSNVIVNTRASVDHDCVVGDHVHIAPGVTICGGVHIGESSHIGVGATVIQGVTIGRRCVIGAGALVLKDVPDGSLVIGVPGRRVSQ